jgi:Fe-S-cluster-containing dehydrogenase component
MQKWNMIIDVAECTNCQLCALAAMDEYIGNDWPGYAAPMPKHGHKWINILQKERGQVPMIDIAYVPTMCNHCDDAPCLAKGGGALKKRDDGIVLIDPEKAKGRKDLVEACPTATSGGTRSFSCHKSGRSTLTSSIRAGSKPGASSRARPAPCARSRSRTRTWRVWLATKASRS